LQVVPEAVGVYHHTSFTCWFAGWNKTLNTWTFHAADAAGANVINLF
jgi:hypothetical protein